jgi:hypothetical protein
MGWLYGVGKGRDLPARVIDTLTDCDKQNTDSLHFQEYRSVSSKSKKKGKYKQTHA